MANKKYAKVNLADTHANSCTPVHGTSCAMTLPLTRGVVFSPSQHLADHAQCQQPLNPPDTSHLNLPNTQPGRAKRQYEPETYLVLALIVSCFFNLPFGLVAVCVSMASREAYRGGNLSSGDWRAILSLCISLLGIFVTALLIIVIITLLLYSDGS